MPVYSFLKAIFCCVCFPYTIYERHFAWIDSQNIIFSRTQCDENTLIAFTCVYFEYATHRWITIIQLEKNVDGNWTQTFKYGSENSSVNIIFKHKVKKSANSSTDIHPNIRCETATLDLCVIFLYAEDFPISLKSASSVRTGKITDESKIHRHNKHTNTSLRDCNGSVSIYYFYYHWCEMCARG